MGVEDTAALRELGKLLAVPAGEPEPPKGLRDVWEQARTEAGLKKVLDMVPKELSSGPCQEVVWEGKDVDLAAAAGADLLAGATPGR